MKLTIAAMLPAIVTLILGYLSGRHKDFSASDAGTFNRLVMLYALPMSLFAGTLATPKDVLIKDFSLVLWVMLPIVIGFFVVFFGARLLFKKSYSESTIYGLLIAAPGITFVGPSVFPVLFGNEVSPILISGGALALNLVLTPTAIIACTYDQQKAANAQSGTKLDISKVVWNSFKEPVVWAPLAAYALALMGVTTDETFTRSFMLLGSVTSGIAMFSTGLVLYSYTLNLSATVFATVIAKNLIFPAVVWAIVWSMGLRNPQLKEVIVSMAIPAGSIATIFAVQYKIMQQQTTSSMFLSYILAPITMTLFIMYS